jgi:hypothetical protein
VKQTNTPISTTHKIAKRISPGTSNANNPYDYIGAQHDAELDYFVNSTNMSNSNYCSNWLSYNSQFFNASSIDTTGLNSMLQAPQFTAITGNIPSAAPRSVAAIAQSLQSNGYITSQSATYLNEIYGALDTNVLKSRNLDSAVGVICNNVMAIESEIQQNITDTTQLKMLLSAASVARFSLSYWANQAADPNNPWGVPSSSALVVEAAGADLGTAAAASVGWGVAVAVFTGPAVGATWGATVLAAGVCGSVGYCVSKLWQWAFN